MHPLSQWFHGTNESRNVIPFIVLPAARRPILALYTVLSLKLHQPRQWSSATAFTDHNWSAWMSLNSAKQPYFLVISDDTQSMPIVQFRPKEPVHLHIRHPHIHRRTWSSRHLQDNTMCVKINSRVFSLNNGTRQGPAGAAKMCIV